MPLSVPQPLGQCGLAGERQTLFGARCAAPGDQAQAVEFDGDVGAHERHRLTVCDRLTERLAFLDVGDHVVEHRVRRADRQRGPAQPGQRDRLRVVRRRSASSSPSRALQWHRHVVEFDAAERGGADAHARVGLDGQALRRRLDDEQRRLAVELRADDEQLGVRGGGHQRLDAVEPVAARRAHRGGLQRGRVEQRVRFGDRHAGLRDVLAGELLAGRWPAGRRCPSG